MQKIDRFSYHCGVIDCFNEMIQADVKQLALSHPIESMDECQALLPYIKQICIRYGTQYYFEENVLENCLFAMKNPMAIYLFYKDEHILQAYLELKRLVQSYKQQHQYTTKRQVTIAESFAQLLSYPKPVYEEMIAKHIQAESIEK